MRGETTEWEAIIKAWNVYVHERLGVFTLPNVSPDVSDYFRAGFAAGIAHARTSADPTRVARLESLLREIEWMGHSFDAGQHYVHCLVCQGIKGVTGHSPHCTLAALLGPADAS